MPFRYTQGNQVVVSPTELSDDEVNEAFGGTTPTSALPAATTGPVKPPPAREVTDLPVKGPGIAPQRPWDFPVAVGKELVNKLLFQPVEAIKRQAESSYPQPTTSESGRGITSGLPDPESAIGGLSGTAAMGGAKMHGLGRSAGRAGRNPYPTRQYPGPAGPPEMFGPPEAPFGPPEPRAPLALNAAPESALPLEEQLKLPSRQLPAAGGTTTARSNIPRNFEAGPRPAERIESRVEPPPQDLERPGAPPYPIPVTETGPAATLKAAKQFETGQQGPALSARERALVNQRRTAEPPSALPPREGPYDYGLPEGVGREPGRVYGVRENRLVVPPYNENAVVQVPPTLASDRVPTPRTSPPPNVSGQREIPNPGLPPGRTVRDVPLGPPAPEGAMPPPRMPQGVQGVPRGQALEGLSADELRALASQQSDRAVTPGPQKAKWGSVAPDVTEAMERSGDPAAARLGQAARDATLKRRGFIHDEFSQGGPALAAVESEEDKALLSLMLDGPVTPQTLQGIAQSHPNVARAYEVMGQRYDALAQARGLPLSARKADYFPHLFPPEVLQAGQMGFDTQAVLARMGQVPSTVRPFFDYVRSGAPGYRLDPHFAYAQYVRRLSDKLFVEPLLKEANELMPQIADPTLKRQVSGYFSRYAAPEPADRIEQLGAALRNGEFYAKLAFNVKWPIVNWLSGRLATFSKIDANPVEAIRAMRVGNLLRKSEAGSEWFNRSGHSGSTFLQEHLDEAGQMSKLREGVTLGVQHLENANRGQAYFAKLWQVMGKPPLATMEAALKSGQIPQEAISAANRFVGQTQALYGPEFDPRWLSQPYLKSLTQFMGTPAKILYGLGPKAALTYAILGESAEELSRAVGGPDMRGALGVGINFQGLYRDLANGVPVGHAIDQNVGQEWAKGRAGIFSFGLAPVVSTVQTGAKLYTRGKQMLTEGVLPGDWKRLGRDALREVTVLNRANQVRQDAGAGGSAWDAARTIAGMPSDATNMRLSIISTMERGEKNKAAFMIREYNKAHPDAPLEYDPQAFNEGRLEFKQRQKARARQQHAVPLPTRKREALPNRAQDALD